MSELPETLDETYERTLREINKADWDLAHRLFQCVAVASRPLRVEELAEFLAFDLESGPIAKFDEGWRLEDPVDAVLSTCSTLLALVDVDGSPIIQFSHFSVKEFLTSGRLAEANDETLRRYHISMTLAHTLIVQACLGILLHLDTTITRDALPKYHLVEYAARHWVNHARFENVSESTEDAMKELFDPRKPHLAIWVWICDPRNPMMDSKRAERPSPPGGTALHYVAVCGLHRIVNFLATEHSQDVNSRGFDYEWAPLHVASAYGHVEVARMLVEQGADVTAQDNGGKTPLHVASKKGHVEVARFLVVHGANPTALDGNGSTPLHVASKKGQVEVARFLVVHGANSTARTNNGETPLHVASIHGHVELVQLLVEHGADPTTTTLDGRTPLHDASTFGHVEVARFLAEHGVNATARTCDGRTPLHLASSYGYMEVARILVEHRADPTAQANDGQSPLHVASSYGNVELTRILVEHGADVTAQDSDGWTPLHCASSCGAVEVARFLVEHGADAKAQDNYGWTPWEVASTKGHIEIARFLVAHGADTTRTAQADDGRTRLPVSAEEGNMEIPVEDATDTVDGANSGWTPLHLAAEEGNVELVRTLVERGADTTARADNGWTPLHVASSCGSMEVARLLIDHGADPTARANDGRTPLDLATEEGNVEVVRVLGTDTTTARPTHSSRFIYYFFVFCFFLEIYLYFM